MALLLRLAIFCFCVASIFAAVVKDEEPTAAPTDATTAGPTEAPCNEGDTEADTTDCHKFSVCKKGTWTTDRCFWFRKFDSVTKKCVMWGATCATA